MLTASLLETPGIQHPPGILKLLSYSNFLIGITCYHTHIRVKAFQIWDSEVVPLSTTKSGTREQGTRPAQPRGHAAATTMRKASVFAEIFASLTMAPMLLCWRMLVARWGLIPHEWFRPRLYIQSLLRCLAISLPQPCQILIFPCPHR